MLPAEEVERIHPGIDILDPTRETSIDVHAPPGNGSKTTVIMYPVREHTLINFAYFVPDTLVPRETEAAWDAEGTRTELLRCSEGCGPFLKAIFS